MTYGLYKVGKGNREQVYVAQMEGPTISHLEVAES